MLMGLSRLPVYLLSVEEDNYLYDLVVQRANWSSLPPVKQTMLQNLDSNTCVHEGQLEKFVNSVWLPYIRPSQRHTLIEEAHLACGHGRLDKTYDMLKTRYYWEGLKTDVQSHLDSCLECSQYKNLPKQFSFTTNEVTSPFHCVSIDVIGPLPKTQN